MLDRIKNSITKSTVRSTLRSVLFRLFDWFYTNAFWGLLQKLDRKFVKFLFVGAINTAFGYTMYSLFITLSLEPSNALLVSYIMGIFWNFKTTGGIVFRNKDNTLIFKFIVSYAFTYTVNNKCLTFLISHLSLNEYLAQALLVLPIAVLSFTIFKTFIFVQKPLQEPALVEPALQAEEEKIPQEAGV